MSSVIHLLNHLILKQPYIKIQVLLLLSLYNDEETVLVQNHRATKKQSEDLKAGVLGSQC